MALSKIENIQDALKTAHAKRDAGELDATAFGQVRDALLKEGLIQVADACGVSLKCEWDDRNKEFRFSPHQINPRIQSEYHSNYGAFARILNQHNPHCGSQAIIVAEDYVGSANLNKHDTEKLIRGFTMDKIKEQKSDVPTFKMFNSPGHGWLEVPTNLLVELGIAGKITSYSYQSKYSAFLEEDCDYSTFVDAMRVRGYDFHVEDEHIREGDAIRCKQCYDSTNLPILAIGDEVAIPSGMGGIFVGEVTELDALNSGMTMRVTRCGDDWNGQERESSITKVEPYYYQSQDNRTIHSEPFCGYESGRHSTLHEFIVELNETMEEDDCTWGDFRIEGDSLFDHYGKEFIPSDGISKEQADRILLAAAYSNGNSLASDLKQANVPFNSEIILAGVQQKKGMKI